MYFYSSSDDSMIQSRLKNSDLAAMKGADSKILKLEIGSYYKSIGKNGEDMSKDNSWKAAECGVTGILKLGIGD